MVKLMKSKYYSQYSTKELAIGFQFMKQELIKAKAPKILEDLFEEAAKDFKNNIWSYDGATFVKERSETTIFEIPAFIHDWRNSNGYVGKNIDKEMLNIMSFLCYPAPFFRTRIYWTTFTYVNVLRHKYYLKDLKKHLPNNTFFL